MQVIEPKAAREYVLANYPNDPLLKHVAITLLEQLPKVDAVEVVHGRWEQGDMYDYGDVCSVCDWDSEREPCKLNYCPNCGAKMDGGAAGE